MGRKTSAEAKRRILTLSTRNFSSSMIRKEHLKSGIDVLKRTICNVLERHHQEIGKKSAMRTQSKKPNSANGVSLTVINKIKQFTEINGKAKKDFPVYS